MAEPARTRVRRKAASIQAAAIAGIVCAVGWALSLRGLLSAPGLGATHQEITAYYEVRSHARAAVFWLHVLVLATIAFLWFVGVIRGRVGDREPRLFGTVFFGSSILLAGSLFTAAALLAAPSVMVEASGTMPDPAAAEMIRAAAAVMLSVFTPRIATLVMFSTGSLGRVTGALPRWLVVLTFALGIAAFVNVTISSPGLYAVPAWIALVSIVLLVRRPAEGYSELKEEVS